MAIRMYSHYDAPIDDSALPTPSGDGRRRLPDRTPKMKTSPLRMIAAGLILAVGVGILVLIVRNNNAGQRDFITYWSAGHQLVHGMNPYDFATILPLERSAGFNRNRALVMRNPPLAFFMALPLGFVSPNTGVVFWLIALLASLVVSIRMIWTMNGRPPNRLHLLGYCFAPVMECLMAGQLGIFLLLGITLFLYFHKTRPMLAGAALLLCSVKPHLFVPFGIVLLLWALTTRAYRILGGFSIALVASCTLSLSVDLQAWPQYRQMLRTSGIMEEIVPTLSEMLRLVVHRSTIWPQFIPEVLGCCWALWYFRTRRECWDWMDQGLLLLLVSVLCSPYSLFPDEALLLPAVMAGLYQAEGSGRSLIPFGLVAGVAMIEVMVEVSISSVYYVWTPIAWLAWYLYATKDKPVGAVRRGAAAMAE